MKEISREILISFCIPTYNRSVFIHRCVKNILEFKGNQIEVVVVNNNSPDNTEETIKSILDNRISYYKNDRNIGSVKNILKTIKNAKGQWVFTLSDEDLVNKEIISRLVNELESGKYCETAVILGNIRKSGGGYHKIPRVAGTKYSCYKYDNVTYEKGDNAIYGAGFHHRYMSGVLINRKYITSNDLIFFSNTHGTSPITGIYTKACLFGDAVTLDADFCIKEENCATKSYIEKSHTESYKHPKNRFLQFTLFVELANEIIVNPDVKIKTILNLYKYYLNSSTFEWEETIKIDNRRAYFNINQNTTFNFWKEAKAFQTKTLKFLGELIVNSTLRESIIKKIEKRFKQIKFDRRTRGIKRALKPLKPILKPVYDLFFKT